MRNSRPPAPPTGRISLVGADSYLRPPMPPRPVRLHPSAEGSALGNADTLRGEVSLDAHAGVLDDVLPPSGTNRPQAVIRVRSGQPGDHPPDQPLLLDGDLSTAAPGRHLQTWTWRLIPPG